MWDDSTLVWKPANLTTPIRRKILSVPRDFWPVVRAEIEEESPPLLIYLIGQDNDDHLRMAGLDALSIEFRYGYPGDRELLFLASRLRFNRKRALDE